jgi:hypothetical protein
LKLLIFYSEKGFVVLDELNVLANRIEEIFLIEIFEALNLSLKPFRPVIRII